MKAVPLSTVVLVLILVASGATMVATSPNASGHPGAWWTALTTGIISALILAGRKLMGKKR
jgi:hypothetical protein